MSQKTPGFFNNLLLFQFIFDFLLGWCKISIIVSLLNNMKVAKPQNVTNWEFRMMNPAGEEVVVGPYGTIYQAVNQVMSYIDVYDTATSYKYGKRLREQAGVYTRGDLTKYVKMMIEHQMCVRHKGNVQCWSGGIGDDIHDVVCKVEGWVLEKAPAPIVKMVRRFAKAASKGKSNSFAGCASCGGTSIMNPAVENLGRAGKLNKFIGTK